METKVSIEKTSEIKRSIQVAIPKDEYLKRFDSALASTTARARIKGFRQGRAPRALIVQMYGKALHQDVMSDLVNQSFQDVVKDHDLKVVGYPNVSMEEPDEGQDFTYTAEVDLFPEPEIKDYWGVSFDVEIVDEVVSDEQVDAELEQFRQQFATFEDVTDREVTEEGDIVEIDYKGLLDGEDFPGSEGTDVMIELGGDGVPEALSGGLVAAKLGETKSLQLPANTAEQSEDEEKKLADYEVTLKKIKRKVLPEFNDEMAKQTGMAEDLAGLREKIKESRVQNAKGKNDKNRRDKFFEALAEKNEFEVPQALVNEEIREILFELGALDRQKRESYQADVSQYADALGSGAAFRVRRYVMLERIVEQEGLTVTEQEVDAWIDEQARESNTDRERIEKAFGLPEKREQVEKMVVREQMIRQLLDKAKIKEVAAKDEKQADSK